MQLRHFLPGQPRELAHPGSLGGYRILLGWVCPFRLILIKMSPSRIFYFFQGRCTTQSGILQSLLFQAEAQLHAVTKWTAMVGGSQDLTPTLLLRLYSLFSMVPESQGGESNSSGPTPAQHQGRKRGVRWTECVTFPLGQGSACQASFLT